MKKESKTKISSTYAKAWYEGALEKKESEKAYTDADKLENVFVSENIKDLSSPILQTSLKKEIIAEVSKKMKLSSSTANLLDILVDNNRFGNLAQVLKLFKSMYYKNNGIVEVGVQTVKELDKYQDAELRNKLEKLLSKKVAVNYEVKPEILGGLIIKYGTYQIDDSIKGKLIHLESIMKGVG